MKRAGVLCVVLIGCFLLISGSFQVGSAAEKTVKFIVPGCV